MEMSATFTGNHGEVMMVRTAISNITIKQIDNWHEIGGGLDTFERVIRNAAAFEKVTKFTEIVHAENDKKKVSFKLETNNAVVFATALRRAKSLGVEVN